jgi:hypothetical protein
MPESDGVHCCDPGSQDEPTFTCVCGLEWTLYDGNTWMTAEAKEAHDAYLAAASDTEEDD